jgi:hypothetical protein
LDSCKVEVFLDSCSACVATQDGAIDNNTYLRRSSASAISQLSIPASPGNLYRKKCFKNVFGQIIVVVVVVVAAVVVVVAAVVVVAVVVVVVVVVVVNGFLKHGSKKRRKESTTSRRLDFETVLPCMPFVPRQSNDTLSERASLDFLRPVFSLFRGKKIQSHLFSASGETFKISSVDQDVEGATFLTI